MAIEQTQQPSPPLQYQLHQMATGHYLSRALFVAAKLGLADLLANGPRDAADLARETKTNAVALRRMMRLLVTHGVFDETHDGKFALTELSECLRSGVPGSARSAVMLFAGGTQNAWAELMYCIETGNPAYRKSGATDPFEGFAKDPEAAANFDEAMAESTRLTAIAVAAAYDFSGIRAVVDVGGGNGALLIGILRAHPRLRGIVFDLPRAIERATTQIEKAGLTDRCNGVGGDFLESVPDGGDIYMLKHVIHDWDDERAITILKNCRAQTRPEGKLLIVEGIYPERLDQSLQSRGAASNDCNMLVATGGRQRSESEFRELYAAAGFELSRIVPTPARVSIIEGIPR